jgi:hypothetical protein
VRGGQLRLCGFFGLVVSCLLLSLGTQAAAQDPEAGLAEAQVKATAAAAEVRDLEAVVEPARSRFDAATEASAPLRSRLRAASARVTAIEHSLHRRHQHAAASVQRIEEEHAEASENHDQTVRVGIGLGISALGLVAIALCWGWFRASAAVAYLVRIELGQAIGLCVGGGLLAVIVGAAMSSTGGIVGVLGFAVLALGFALPVAFVLARHSAEVQRGRASAHLRRERLPERATRSLAGLFAALFLLFLGSAVFAGEANSGSASAALRAEANDPAPSSPTLAAAEARASDLETELAPSLVEIHRRRADLIAAQHQLGRAQTRLADAEGDEGRFSRRLAAIEQRELLEQERAEREAQKQAEVEEREYEEAAQEEEELGAEECDPNYSGCLDPNAVDYDCEGGSGDGPLYTGTVEVLGVDHYGLDEDGDGIGCDP